MGWIAIILTTVACLALVVVGYLELRHHQFINDMSVGDTVLYNTGNGYKPGTIHRIYKETKQVWLVDDGTLLATFVQFKDLRRCD